MIEVALFLEDFGHKAIIRAFLERVVEEARLDVRIIERNVRGGHGKVVSELKRYVQDIKHEREDIPDLLVVATDANCVGFSERKREIEDVTDQFHLTTAFAIPDPHVERWLMIDSSAFKKVFGRGCRAPDQKCERDRYKNLLREEIQHAGINPPLGGLEYAGDLVAAMNLSLASKSDPSLKRFLDDLGRCLTKRT